MSATNNTFYDKLTLNSLHFKRKKGGQHDIGVEPEMVIPTPGEIRLLGNRHVQCAYYQVGVEVCHTQMLKENSGSFLPCKEPIDGLWRCYTEGKYGQSIRDAPEYTKPHEKQFYDCMFREGTGLDICMPHFTDMVRSIYRSGESELCDWF